MTMERLRPHLLPVILLVAATFAVYGRTLGHDFLINWDDNVYVTANSSVHGFSPENIKAVFTGFYAGNYAPLQMLSYMCDYTLWGLWPGGFLLTNVTLHTLNGLLLYTILLKSEGERLMASVAAGIFLFHPLQVESVAWISQRKNLLAMFFMLLSWQAYIRYRKSVTGGRHVYLLSVAAFLCSLLAKSAAVFFPVALLLYEYCIFAREQHARLLDKLPFFALALAAALLTMQSQSPEVTGWSGLDFGGRSPWHGGTPLATFLTMLPVFCSYLRLVLWPTGLSAIYSPVIYKTVELPVAVAFIVVFCSGWLVWRLCRVNRRVGFWPMFSLLAILPVVQIVPLVTLMNDRYLYFPLIGIAALGGAGAVAVRRCFGEKLSGGLSLVILLLLALVSFQRAGIWEDSRSLWSDAVKKVPGKFDVWEGLGEAYHLAEPVRLKEAEYAYSRAFALYSSGPNNLFNLARVKLAQGDEARGVILLNRLLRVNPEYVMGWIELGDVYFRRADFVQAERTYLQAEKLQPEALEVNLRLYRLSSARGDAAAARFYSERVTALGGDISLLKP